MAGRTYFGTSDVVREKIRSRFQSETFEYGTLEERVQILRECAELRGDTLEKWVKKTGYDPYKDREPRPVAVRRDTSQDYRP
ncbi:MAG: hypothetical protein C4320_04170 [Armatimonadota bacterium]